MSRNQGINIGGDGMGGRRGASRQWGFGDDSDADENAPRYTTKGGNRAASASASLNPTTNSSAAVASHSDIGAPSHAARSGTLQMPNEEGLVVGKRVGHGAGENGGEATMGGMAKEGGFENNMDSQEHKKIYERGLQMRKLVVGEDYVAKSLQDIEGNEFMRPFVQFATEAAWSTIWTRPGLELKTRSLLNLVMLTALGKWTELGTHVRGAVRNGATEIEIREALLQATAYCGMPAGMEAFRVADKVLKDLKFKGEF